LNYVLDAQTALRWHFEDEMTPEDDALLERFSNGWRAIVPSLFFYEVANVLAMDARRRSPRTSQARSEAFIADLTGLPLELDDASTAQALNKTLALARQFRLSVYDAAYLETAMRFGLALASRDTELVAAARQAGVRLVFPLDSSSAG
jgi:predicted nucleic acid-binding protein